MAVSESNLPQTGKMPHNIVIENRKSVTATGIRSIVSYDSESATLETDLGTLIVGGEGITVSELSVRAGRSNTSSTHSRAASRRLCSSA